MKRSHVSYRKKLLPLPILLLLVLSLLTALSLNIVEVSAGEYPAIYIEPATIENATFTPGTNFTISIKTDYNGSDVWGYEDVTLTYNPLVLEGARIPKTDTWTGDNVAKLFFTTNKIIVPGSEEVYVNETLMTRGPDYTIDYQTGKITFTTAPGKVEVKITYLYYGITNGDLITGTLAMFISAGFDDTLGKLGRTSNGFFLTNIVTSGPGTLANVTFTVVGKGATNITLGPETKLIGRAPPDYYPYTIPTNTQHGYFDNRFPHDVAVVSVAAQAEATVGNVSIDVEVVNFGKSDEEVEVAVSYDSVPIGTEQILVFVGESETALFSWNTAGLVQGSYAINATATILEDDDPTDNWKTTTFLLTHDIAVVSVTAPDKAPVESLVPISVEVVNIGSLTEVANVTVRYDLTIIGFKDTVMIPVQNSTTVRFDWETTGVAVGTYTINATATIGDDGDPTDNWKNTTIFLVAGDVAVVSVTAPDKAPVESLVPISVEVANEGAFLVVANVTVRYDLTIIGFNDTVELPVGESRTVLFSWNTTGLAQGNYTLNATARLMNKTDAWTALGINNTDAWTALGINNTDMWAGDGVNTTFTTTGKPIIEDSEKVYVNQTLMTKPANYTIDYEMGNITFTTAPELGANVTAIYSYLKKSFVTTQKPVVPDSENVYVNQILVTRITQRTDTWTGDNVTKVFYTTGKPIVEDSEEVYMNFTDMWAGDGVNTTFTTTGKPIIEDSEKVYVNQTLMTKPANYTIDYEMGNITFTTAPGFGAEIKATYKALMIRNVDYAIDYATGTITFTTAPEEDVEVEAIYLYVHYTIDYEMGNITFTTAPELGANVTAIYSYLKKSFVTTQKPVVPDSENVYVNQTLMTKPANYTIDYEMGNITFTTAPGFGAEIKAIYLPVDTDPTDNWNTTTILIVEHDVAIISLDAPAEAAVGDIVPINVNITNIGSSDENVTLTVSYAYEHPSEPPPTVIDTRNFTINIGLSETVSFNWNTTGLAQGNYTLNATATIPRDDDPTDNWNTTKITLKCHDIEVISVKPSPHKVFVGELVDITVEVKNVGDYNETFKVKVSYDTNTITESQQIELSLGNSTTLSFKWNTTGVAPALYMIWAEAILEADVDPKNNKRGYPAIVELPLGTILGKVTDVSTDLPIAGANITAGDYSATTDAEGHYNITDVPAGTYNVTASKTGYESASQLNIIVVAGETTPVNFTLRVSSTITISADPTTTTVDESTTISGSIDPTREGVTVTIWYRLSGEEAWTNLTNVTTNENSQYSYVWTPEAAGTYEVKASWLGDDCTSPAESDGQTVTVKEAPTPGIPWHIYVVAAGVVAIAIVAIAFYFLRIRKPKPT